MASLSSQMRRSARRLRKKGYAHQSGQMALAAEQARLNEPTIMRPEHRELEAQAQYVFATSQELAAQPDFDYARDIAPLRGDFFGALARSGMTPAVQAGYRRKYEPQFADLDKDQSAFLQLQESQRKAREQRKIDSLAPIVAQRLKGVLDPELFKTDEERSRGVKEIITDYPEAMRSPATASMLSVFDKSYGGAGVDRKGMIYRGLAGQLAGQGDLGGIQALPITDPYERDAYERLAIHAQGKAQKVRGTEFKKAQLSSLNRLKGDVDVAQKWVLGDATADKNEDLLKALREQGKIPTDANVNSKKARKAYLISLYLRAMGVDFRDLTDEDKDSFNAMTVADIWTRLQNIIDSRYREFDAGGNTPSKRPNDDSVPPNFD